MTKNIFKYQKTYNLFKVNNGSVGHFYIPNKI